MSDIPCRYRQDVSKGKVWQPRCAASPRNQPKTLLSEESTSSRTHPRIHPKLRRLTRKYRCLGGIPCAVKLLKVKVRCRLTRKRSLVRIQSCLPYLSMV